MVLGIIRRLRGKPVWNADESVNPLKGVPGSEDEFDFDTIIAQLEVARDRAKQVYYRIMDELGSLHSKFHEAVRGGDRDTAEIVAAEIVVKKRHLKVLVAYIKLLEAAIARVKTTRDLTEVAKLFTSVNVVLKSMEGYMYDSPELTAVFAQFTTAAENVIGQSTILSQSLPVPTSVAELDPEVKKMLATAFEEAEKETRSIIPSIPEPMNIDYAELEAKLLEFIRMNNGILNVKKAANHFGVSTRVIKEVLYRLEKKGIIKVTGKASANEASYA